MVFLFIIACPLFVEKSFPGGHTQNFKKGLLFLTQSVIIIFIELKRKTFKRINEGELIVEQLVIWITIAIYVIFMAVVGVLNSKSANGGLANFTVGGRNAGPWLSAFSYGTTYFSAVVFIGYAGNSGWNFGLWAVVIGLGNAVIGSLLAWLVLARRTREVTQRLRIKTMPQFMEKRFQSKGLKYFSAVIIFIFLIPYSASVYSGLGYLCDKVLGIPYAVCMAVIAIAAAIILILGGYLATLKADFIQGIIMLGGVIVLILFITFSGPVAENGGLPELVSRMDAAGIAALDGGQLKGLISLVVLTSIGTWGLPQMIHKYYGIADDRAVKRGAIISTLFAVVISGGAYYIGSLSRMFFTQEEVGGLGLDNLVPQMLMNANLPHILLGLVLVLVVAASVSTLSGLTLTSASSISMDIIRDGFKKDMKEQQTLLLTRVLCFVFILFSYCVAVFKIEAILNLMAFSWGAIAGAFLAPYLLALYWKGVNRCGAWCGMLIGLGLTLALNIKDIAVLGRFALPNAPFNGSVAMAASLAACVLGSLLASRCGWKSGEKNPSFYDKKVV